MSETGSEEKKTVELPPDFEQARAAAIKILSTTDDLELAKLLVTLRCAYNVVYTLAYATIDRTFESLDAGSDSVDQKLVCEIILQSVKQAAGAEAKEASPEVCLQRLLHCWPWPMTQTA